MKITRQSGTRRTTDFAQQRWAGIPIGSGIHYPSGDPKQAKAHVALYFTDMKNDKVTYDVEMTPEEAVRIGKRLIALGEEYTRKLAEAHAKTDILPRTPAELKMAKIDEAAARAQAEKINAAG